MSLESNIELNSKMALQEVFNDANFEAGVLTTTDKVSGRQFMVEVRAIEMKVED